MVKIAQRVKNLRRLRHRKGFGVHSPFVYTLVREVFTKRICDSSILNQLKEIYLKERQKVEIANFIEHIKATNFGVDVESCKGFDLVVSTNKQSQESLNRLIAESRNSGTTLIITTWERKLQLKEIVKAHTSTTIDKRGYLIMMNNHLPKQHFVL